MDYLLLFLFAFVFEVAYTSYSISVSRNRIVTATLANGLIPFLQLLAFGLLIDAQTWPQRILICGATAVGYMAGTATTMLAFKNRGPS